MTITYHLSRFMSCFLLALSWLLNIGTANLCIYLVGNITFNLFRFVADYSFFLQPVLHNSLTFHFTIATFSIEGAL